LYVEAYRLSCGCLYEYLHVVCHEAADDEVVVLLHANVEEGLSRNQFSSEFGDPNRPLGGSTQIVAHLEGGFSFPVFEAPPLPLGCHKQVVGSAPGYSTILELDGKN
jgi:hypothetical protein